MAHVPTCLTVVAVDITRAVAGSRGRASKASTDGDVAVDRSVGLASPVVDGTSVELGKSRQWGMDAARGPARCRVGM